MGRCGDSGAPSGSVAATYLVERPSLPSCGIWGLVAKIAMNSRSPFPKRRAVARA